MNPPYTPGSQPADRSRTRPISMPELRHPAGAVAGTVPDDQQQRPFRPGAAHRHGPLVGYSRALSAAAGHAAPHFSLGGQGEPDGRNAA